MANRRISEFPPISGGEIDEQDLLTLVHVFEVDPTLRNKKITFTQFKEYLNEYYAPASGATFSGNVTITGNLTVSGTSSFNSITASGSSTFSGIVVQNNAVVSGTVSSPSGVFTNLSGTTYTGTTVNATTGVFQTLAAINLAFTNTTVSGNLNVLGPGFFASGVQITGTLSGTTITGTTVQAVTTSATTGTFTSLTGTTTTGVTATFTTVSGVTVTGATGVFTNITGSTLRVTTPSGATPAIVCSGVVSGGTSGFVIRGPLIILE